MLKQNINDINNIITKRYLDNPQFDHIPPKYISLTDIVLCYNNGYVMRIIPLKIAQKYPIIYDSYYDQVDSDEQFKESEITFTFCPYSCSSVVYFGKFKATDQVHKNNIILISPDDKLLLQIDGLMYVKDQNDYQEIKDLRVRKIEVRMMKYRTALTKYLDATYI